MTSQGSLIPWYTSFILASMFHCHTVEAVNSKDRDRVIHTYQAATDRCRLVTNQSRLEAREAANEACEKAFESLDNIGLNDCEGWSVAQCRPIPGQIYQQCSVTTPVCEMFYQKRAVKTFVDCAPALMTEEMLTGTPPQLSDSYLHQWQKTDQYYWNKYRSKGNQGSARVEPFPTQHVGSSLRDVGSSFAESASHASGSSFAPGVLYAAGSSTSRAGPSYSVGSSHAADPTQAFGVLPSTSSFYGTNFALTAGPSGSGPPPASGPSGSGPPIGQKLLKLSDGSKRKSRSKSSARRTLALVNPSSDLQAPYLEVTEQVLTETGNPTANPDAPMSNVVTCKECDKSFLSERSLRSHQESHKGITRCSICSKNLSTKKSFTNHMKKKHGEERSKEPVVKEHACDQCDKRFSHPSALSDHRAFHTGKTTCPFCNIVLARISVLQRHIKEKHPETLH